MEKNKAELIYSTRDNTVGLFNLDGDMTIADFHNYCARLALAVGYHPKSVSIYFGDHSE